MANPVYLWLYNESGEQIDGAVRVAGREGSIELMSLDHCVATPTDDNTGALTATRIHSAYEFVKEVDPSSTYLYKAVTSGETLQKAVFYFYRINSSGKETLYYKTTLEDVKVVKVAAKVHDIKDPAKQKHTHLEHVELRYKKITWLYLDGTLEHSDEWNER